MTAKGVLCVFLFVFFIALPITVLSALHGAADYAYEAMTDARDVVRNLIRV